MGNTSTKKSRIQHSKNVPPTEPKLTINPLTTTNPMIKSASLAENTSCIFKVQLQDILNSQNDNQWQLEYKVKEDDDWNQNMIDIYGTDFKYKYPNVFYLRLPLYIHPYSMKIRMRCQHISTRTYSEYTNIFELYSPSILNVKFSKLFIRENHFDRLDMHYMKAVFEPIYDLSSHGIKINEYQNLLLPRTMNKQLNEEILNMFVIISQFIEAYCMTNLGLIKIDSYYYSKSVSKYIIDLLYYDNEKSYRQPKIYAFYESENSNVSKFEIDCTKCVASIKILPFRKYDQLCKGLLRICGFCGMKVNQYNWFCQMNHSECKSTYLYTCKMMDPFAFACLTCVNQYLQKYMLLYAYLNDILNKLYSLDANSVQEIVSYTVGNIVLHEKGVWTHVNDVFFDFFF